MIDHLSFSVNDFTASVRFYDETLKILGFERVMTFNTEEHQVAGYGSNGKPSFWIGVEPFPPLHESVGSARSFHVAFTAPSPQAILEWHQRCLEFGGSNNGAPGLRPEYHPHYFGGFIIDPNGWRIEAVCHG